MTHRIESGSLGSVTLPARTIYGIQPVRAVENFPISNVLLSHFPRLEETLAIFKKTISLARASDFMFSFQKHLNRK